jgi:hypothetical protein
MYLVVGATGPVGLGGEICRLSTCPWIIHCIDWEQSRLPLRQGGIADSR